MQNATKDNPSDFTIDEVEEILNAGSMSKDAVRVIMMNARDKNAITNIPENSMAVVMDFMMVMQKQQQDFMSLMIKEIKTINKPELKTSEQLLIEPVPEKSSRAIFIEKMKEFTKVSGKNYRDAYHFVYDEIGAIYSIRIMARAKNRKCTGVDVIESDGYMGKSIAVIINLIRSLEEGV